MSYKIHKCFMYIRRYGIIKLLRKYIEKKNTMLDYSTCNSQDGVNSDISISATPKISILIPAYNPKKSAFIETLQSVKRQTYENWQLCISNGGSESLEGLIAEVFESDNRVKYIENKTKSGISDNTNNALQLADGEYIAFFDHDDILEADALMESVKCINMNNPDLIYTDEDKVSADLTSYFATYRKMDFNYPLILSNNYICHFCIVRKEILEQAGILRSEYDGAQDYDFILRVTDITRNIVHIPKVLYHWRTGEQSTSDNPFNKEYAFTAGKRAIEDTLKRNGNTDTEVYELDDPGYYRVSYTGEVMNHMDEYTFLPENIKLDTSIKEKMVRYAILYKADAVVPKLIHRGKYVYSGQGALLAGKPAWYKGRFNLAQANMNVTNAPTQYILVKKGCNGHYTNAVYAPEIVIKIKDKEA